MTTTIDPRVRARRIEVMRHAGRRRRHRAAVATLILAVLGGLAVTAIWSPLLKVRHVRVDGLPDALALEVAAEASPLVGRSLLLADLGALRRHLLADPRLAAVSTSKEPPGTIRIVAARRLPVAQARAPGGAALVAADGVVVAMTTVTDGVLPWLSGAPVTPTPGAVAVEAQPSLAALAALPPRLGGLVRQAIVAGDGGLTLLLEGGPVVAFGQPADEPARKGVVLDALVSDAATRGWVVRTYNVMSPDAPAVTPA